MPYRDVSLLLPPLTGISSSVQFWLTYNSKTLSQTSRRMQFSHESLTKPQIGDSDQSKWLLCSCRNMWVLWIQAHRYYWIPSSQIVGFLHAPCRHSLLLVALRLPWAAAQILPNSLRPTPPWPVNFLIATHSRQLMSRLICVQYTLETKQLLYYGETRVELPHNLATFRTP